NPAAPTDPPLAGAGKVTLLSTPKPKDAAVPDLVIAVPFEPADVLPAPLAPPMNATIEAVADQRTVTVPVLPAAPVDAVPPPPPFPGAPRCAVIGTEPVVTRTLPPILNSLRPPTSPELGELPFAPAL